MTYYLLMCFLGPVLDLFATARIAADEEDLQIRTLERNSQTKLRLSRCEKLMLLMCLQWQTQGWYERLCPTLLLFKLDTLLKWHREPVRRKWTFEQLHRGGRRVLDAEFETLILQLARASY